MLARVSLVVSALLYAAVCTAVVADMPSPELSGIVMAYLRPMLIGSIVVGSLLGLAPWHRILFFLAAATLLSMVVRLPHSEFGWWEAGANGVVLMAALVREVHDGFRGAWAPGYFSEILSLLPSSPMPTLAPFGSDTASIRTATRALRPASTADDEVGVEFWESEQDEYIVLFGLEDGRLSRVRIHPSESATDADTIRCFRHVAKFYLQTRFGTPRLRTPYFLLAGGGDQAADVVWAYPRVITARLTGSGEKIECAGAR